LNPAFWDSSSLFSLCCFEPATAVAEEFAGEYWVAVWWATWVEIRGAIARRARSAIMPPQIETEALRRLELLRSVWVEVEPSPRVRERALKLITQYELRAADALQLAAAVEWRAGDSVRMMNFISGDKRLLAAAREEGFAVHSTT
jgi:predicted nucleic acid-binding protein